MIRARRMDASAITAIAVQKGIAAAPTGSKGARGWLRTPQIVSAPAAIMAIAKVASRLAVLSLVIPPPRRTPSNGSSDA